MSALDPSGRLPAIEGVVPAPATRQVSEASRGADWVYRPELNSLRGLAIAAGHHQPDVVPGGHLGVTGFFVLSGFLITSLLTGRRGQT